MSNTEVTETNTLNVRECVECMKKVIEFVDYKVRDGTIRNSFQSAFIDIMREELKTILKEASINAQKCQSDDLHKQVQCLEIELQRKKEHIEILEQLVFELQTALRLEVDKPALLKAKNKSGVRIDNTFSQLTESRDSFEDIPLDDDDDAITMSNKTNNNTFMGFFRKVESKKAIVTVSDTVTVVKPPEVTTNKSSSPVSNITSPTASTNGESKRRPKKLIHFVEPASDANKQHKSLSCKLSDFLDD